MNPDPVALLVDFAAALRDPRTPAGDLARRAAARDGALSETMADWAVRTAVARYTPSAVAACCAQRDLEGRDVALLLASGVPTAPLRAIALPLLRGATRISVRPSRHQPAFASLVVESLAAAGAPVVLAAPGEPGAFVAESLVGGARTFIAYGSDETLRDIQSDLPEGVAFEGRGHGFGVAVVCEEAASDDSAIEAVARDIVHYDQLGCLSPQCVFVEAADAVIFSERLANALDKLERALPRGPLEAALAARVNQWQGAFAASSAAFHRGVTYAVAALAAPMLPGSPGARNVAVVPVGALADIAAALAPEAVHLTCVGVAGSLDRVRELALPPASSPRVVAAGTMQDPPLDGPEDPRPPTVWSPRATRF